MKIENLKIVLKALFSKENSPSGAALADILVQESIKYHTTEIMKDPSNHDLTLLHANEMQEALNWQFIAYFRDTFQYTKEGDLSVTEQDLVNISSFVKKFNLTIRKVMNVDLANDVLQNKFDVNNGVEALKAYSIAFPTYTKLLNQFDIPVPNRLVTCV